MDDRTVGWSRWKQFLSLSKEGRFWQYGQLVVVAVLGLSISVLFWGRTADQCLEDRRPAPLKEDARNLSKTLTASEAVPESEDRRGEADGDGLFFEILDAYAHLRQETPG